jgi:hypothetical protein
VRPRTSQVRGLIVVVVAVISPRTAFESTVPLEVTVHEARKVPPEEVVPTVIEDEHRWRARMCVVAQPAHQGIPSTGFQCCAGLEHRIAEVETLEFVTQTLRVPVPGQRGRADRNSDDQPEGEEYAYQ